MEKMSDINTSTQEYVKVIPQISYYLTGPCLPPIFKYKCPLFAAAGNFRRIYIFSNSLEHMGTFLGNKAAIRCLCAMSHKILASGLYDNTIQIWDIENRAIMSTLSQHTDYVSALCNMGYGVFVSGSKDQSLIIWSKYELPGSSSASTFTYSQRVLTGHKSEIMGIIRLNNIEIISGESKGDLRIWNIVEGVCTKHIIPHTKHIIKKMTEHMGDVVVSHITKIRVWGAGNNWVNTPLKRFEVCDGCSLEFLTPDILLRGGDKGQLEFIAYRLTGRSLPPPIKQLHSNKIDAIQRIAKNIVLTISIDGFKVIDPISRNGYLNFQIHYSRLAIAYFY